PARNRSAIAPVGGPAIHSNYDAGNLRRSPELGRRLSFVAPVRQDVRTIRGNLVLVGGRGNEHLLSPLKHSLATPGAPRSETELIGLEFRPDFPCIDNLTLEPQAS